MSTGATGSAFVVEAPAEYRVVPVPVPADGTFKPVAGSDCSVAGSACVVHLEKDSTVTFKATRDKLTFHLSPASIVADGLGSSYGGEVEDVGQGGAPAPGVSIKFTPPVESIPVSSKGVDVVHASSRLTRAATVSLRSDRLRRSAPGGIGEVGHH